MTTVSVVAGGNGLVGRALVRELVHTGGRVIVLGTSGDTHTELALFANGSVSYVQVREHLGDTEKIADRIKATEWFTGGGVFYNLAWRGKAALVDGDVIDQVRNIGLSVNFTRLAKSLGCIKFVSGGSMEEVALRRFYEERHWLRDVNLPKPTWYSVAKRGAAMQMAFEAYRQKIDHCHVQISTVIDCALNTPKYIEQSFRKIIKDGSRVSAQNTELRNIASSEEIARQLCAIGARGKNKIEYVLGTETSARLDDYFSCLGRLRDKGVFRLENVRNPELSILKESDFSVAKLRDDTGYVVQESVESLFLKIREKV